MELKSDPNDRIKSLYPMVNEEETPLPRSWSPKDRYNYVGLCENDLRVFYKGFGKTHKDAASVRATHPIPTSCGLYYFEVKIVSKGRDGYMGIGLSAQGVNMNRLPGWDKHSYGYHGDDGHSFCSSGTGQPYGPTFSTGDVIGCGVNLIDNTCFYTKNGHYLGTAFTDLPPNLYPTVGLQTPGEIVDGNFGQQPFVFHIEDIILGLKQSCLNTILNHPMNNLPGDSEEVLQSMVSTFLVHHGYCVTAQAFASNTHQVFDEEITSIKNRQKILKLVLAGRMGEAIDLTSKLYPGLLEVNRNLLFHLKCRQFVEMVNGTDSEMCSTTSSSLSSSSSSRSLLSSSANQLTNHNNLATMCSCGQLNNKTTNNSNSRPKSNTKYQNGNTRYLADVNNHHNNVLSTSLNNSSTTTTSSKNSTNKFVCSDDGAADLEHDDVGDKDEDMLTQQQSHLHRSPLIEDCIDEIKSSKQRNRKQGNCNLMTSNANSNQHKNGNHNLEFHNSSSNNCFTNGNGGLKCVAPGDEDEEDVEDGELQNENAICTFCQNNADEEMDVDPPSRQLCGGSKPAIERMLDFGRELFVFSVQLRQAQGKNENNKKMLQDAFSLLAYSNPWDSPVGWQLDPIQRETVCAALNSAILESSNLARRPPLEVSVAHARELINFMSKKGFGVCAFGHVDEILNSTVA